MAPGIRRAILLWLAFPALAAPVGASVSLQVGDLDVRVSPAGRWTIEQIFRGANAMSSGVLVGSAQGTVIMVDDLGWAGSHHGYETVLNTNLRVDGTVVDLIDGLSYSGQLIQLRRTTQIGGAYQLSSTLTITAESIDEYIAFSGLDESKNVSVFYGFLSSRANRLMDYASFDTDGQVLQTGQTSANDRLYSQLGSPRAMAQYNPVQMDGICSVLTLGSDLGFNAFIWDKIGENKFYVRHTGVEGPADPATGFEISWSMRFFDADAEHWLQTASELALSAYPIPGDANLDHRASLGDLSILASNWQTPGDKYWSDGDFNGDRTVSIGDLAVLAGNWGSPATQPPQAVPGPAPICLLAAGAVGLLRRKTGR